MYDILLDELVKKVHIVIKHVLDLSSMFLLANYHFDNAPPLFGSMHQGSAMSTICNII